MKRLTLADLPPKYQEQVVGANRPRFGVGAPIIIPASLTVQRAIGPLPTFFTLPYPPSANNYWRSFVIKGKVRVVVSKEAKAFKKAVALAMAGFPTIKGNVCITATFYRPRKIGDLDNLLKVTLDALKGTVFEDDKQIVRIQATRADDKENPRVQMSVCAL